MKPKLLVLGPNPAWQKVLHFPQFCCGEVNRAASMLEFASGKGINFCRAAGISGRTEAILLQAAGGENGRRLTEYLEREKMTVRTVPAGPTRCCVSCCGPDGNCTEIIEPSAALTPEEASSLLRMFDGLLAGAEMAAFCGSLPDGSDPVFYRHCADLAAAGNVTLFLDTVKDLPELLDRSRRSVVKINRSELARVTGEKTVQTGLKRLLEYESLCFAAITDGPGRAYAATCDAQWEYDLPALKSILSPIGCGDTCGAVTASELLAGAAPEEAFLTGLAAASANCLTPVYGHYKVEDADMIRRDIRMRKV